MSLEMTESERDQFLADVRIGIVAASADGRGPLTAPVWYGYEPGGEIVFSTGARSAKARAMRDTGRATMTVQSEQPPYRYVTVEGPVTFAPGDDATSHALAVRYLGEGGAEAYRAAGGGSEDSTVVRIRPERWHSVDYGKMGQ